MKNNFFIFLLVCNITFLYSEIEFRAATQADIPGILKLMSNEPSCKNIYPTKRRPSALNVTLKSAIESNNIFVAVENTTFCCRTIGKIIGFKKICIDNQSSEVSIEIEGCCNDQLGSKEINMGLLDEVFNALIPSFKEKKDLSKINFRFKNVCKTQVEDAIKSFMDGVNIGKKLDQKVKHESIELNN